MRKVVLEALGDEIDDDEFIVNNKDPKKNGGVLYMSQIECVLTKALSVSCMKKMHASTITPITIPIRDHSSGLPPSTVGTSYLVPTPGKKIKSILFYLQ